MSWTIACFCGNTYAAPPDRCPVCGSTIDGVSPTASTTEVDAVVARAVTEADLRAVADHSLHTSNN